jgi:serine protease inhibitor
MPVTATTATGFGLRLLERLGPGQVAFSPLSVHRALATLREGASGEARAALDEVLGYDAPPLEVRDPAIRLALAQGLWLDPAYRLVPEFAEAAGRRGVDCRSLDLQDPSAAAAVNAWAAERTEGMIDHVVDAFEREEKLALADAAYFEGAWTTPFRREDTQSLPFTRPDGSRVPVPTMRRHAFEYAERDGLRAVRLPYGDEGELAFVAVIAGEGPAAPELDETAWQEITGAIGRRHGEVALPRLRLESRLELGAPLRALGLEAPFDPGHDFDGLFEGPAPAKALGRVLHRARVDLDERGTRAAAVTVATVIAVSMPAGGPFDLRLDRPFVWAIEHRGTGTLLFLGRVTDPSSTAEERT